MTKNTGCLLYFNNCAANGLTGKHRSILKLLFVLYWLHT